MGGGGATGGGAAGGGGCWAVCAGGAGGVGSKAAASGDPAAAPCAASRCALRWALPTRTVRFNGLANHACARAGAARQAHNPLPRHPPSAHVRTRTQRHIPSGMRARKRARKPRRRPAPHLLPLCTLSFPPCKTERRRELTVPAPATHVRAGRPAARPPPRRLRPG